MKNKVNIKHVLLKRCKRPKNLPYLTAHFDFDKGNKTSSKAPVMCPLEYNIR